MKCLIRCLPVWADAELIERVLKNLVDNSIKFTPSGGVIRVTAVATTNDQTNEPGLLVSVTDNGPGIPSAAQPQIFEQFVTGNHVESGSGLGLAFCKMALAAHDQTIWSEQRTRTRNNLHLLPICFTRRILIPSFSLIMCRPPYYAVLSQASVPLICETDVIGGYF